MGTAYSTLRNHYGPVPVSRPLIDFAVCGKSLINMVPAHSFDRAPTATIDIIVPTTQEDRNVVEVPLEADSDEEAG